ncbi:zonular occludens toxin domain-containing protein [Demequina lutea]|uniref:Zona occludens toxin N-terminal domain-containing protein n=1 Tax=Demequina lutea TaxID=431489 RepID=A0A7Y9ZDL4_9MICO|nr:zonular occludens toxin domain-containing protein [Demequina lutea]NYI41411.1 hypothetical protein [Demequina lutea]
MSIRLEGLWPGMIRGVIGAMGSGKSLEGVKRAVGKHRAGVDVYSSTPLTIDGEDCPVVTPENLMKVKNGFILLDEVHLWLPSRRSLKTPLVWLEWMSQIRKEGVRVEILWTAQVWNRLDVALRDLTLYVTKAERWNLGLVEAYVYKTFAEDQFPRGKYMKREIVRRSRTASGAYSTDYKIERAGHLRDERDPYDGGARDRAQEQLKALLDKTRAAAAAPAVAPVAVSTSPTTTEWGY